MTPYSLDFETYSHAGLQLDPQTGKWSGPIAGSTKKGLPLVGAYVYAEHHSTEVLTAVFSAPNDTGGEGSTIWYPGYKNSDALIAPLLTHVARGGIITAWNSFFEWCIWNLVCCRRYGWPPLPIEQTRDSMARALAWSLPGSLDKASAVVFGQTQKDTAGAALIRRLCMPRNQTAKDKRLRLTRTSQRTDRERDDWNNLDAYCMRDVRAEIYTASVLPELSPRETDVWLVDQRINARGVGIDLPLVEACIKIIETARDRAASELSALTGGVVGAVSQATAMQSWVNTSTPAYYLKDLQEETLTEYLDSHADLPPAVRRVLEIRQEVGGSAVAKLQAMKYMTARDGRARGVLQFCGAQRTRRWAGRGIQTQNMLNPSVEYSEIEASIPWLLTGDYDTMASAGYDNPAQTVGNCLRSMLISAPGYDFISSDYSAIEAVVLACLAGEQWVIDVFNTDGKLYERTAEKITGTSLAEMLAHRECTGSHHPDRKIGKVGDLAGGYQGARGAWLKFGAGKFLTNRQIDDGVKAWREARPATVHFWYACNDAAMAAIATPGRNYPVARLDGSLSGVSYTMSGRALYCFLPNGEWLTYVDPSIREKKALSGEGYRVIELCERAESDISAIYELQSAVAPDLFEKIRKNRFKVSAGIRALITARYWKMQPTIYYWGVQSGQWIELETYGGKLCENITQATARMVLSEALIRVESAGYPVVLHTHDELVAEVPEGAGSVEELEQLMAVRPWWAESWPIKAAGGWRGKRYRK